MVRIYTYIYIQIFTLMTTLIQASFSIGNHAFHHIYFLPTLICLKSKRVQRKSGELKRRGTVLGVWAWQYCWLQHKPNIRCWPEAKRVYKLCIIQLPIGKQTNSGQCTQTRTLTHTHPHPKRLAHTHARSFTVELTHCE